MVSGEGGTDLSPNLHPIERRAVLFIGYGNSPLIIQAFVGEEGLIPVGIGAAQYVACAQTAGPQPQNNDSGVGSVFAKLYPSPIFL